MTSAKRCRPDRAGRSPWGGAVMILVMLIVVCGCAQQRTMVVLRAPYETRQVWAVVPLMNESGVSDVDTFHLADLIAEEIQQVERLDALPVNRVIAAMRELELREVRTTGDARVLMNVLGVDGLVVGTVTAYDPYRPLRLGVAMQLFASGQAAEYASFDPRELSTATVGEVAPGGVAAERAVAQSAGVFDATNHRTLEQLRRYAAGRAEPDSAFGEQIYLVSMDRFARFASYQLVAELLRVEQERHTVVLAEQELPR